jgi:hypothetical protein
VRDIPYIPKITPDKDQEFFLMLRALVELLLKT